MRVRNTAAGSGGARGRGRAGRRSELLTLNYPRPPPLRAAAGWPQPPRSAPLLGGRPDGTDRGWFELVRLHDDTRGAISSGAAAGRLCQSPQPPPPPPLCQSSGATSGRRSSAGGSEAAGGRLTGAAGGPARSAAASPWGWPAAPVRSKVRGARPGGWEAGGGTATCPCARGPRPGTDLAPGAVRDTWSPSRLRVPGPGDRCPPGAWFPPGSGAPTPGPGAAPLAPARPVLPAMAPA